MADIEAAIRAIEIWETQRELVFARNPYMDGTNGASLREFVEIQNSCANALIRAFERESPDFWDAFSEVIAAAKVRIQKGGKTFVNKQDVTSQTEGHSI